MEAIEFCKSVNEELTSFHSFQLTDLAESFLMDRLETKFLLEQKQLFALLRAYKYWKVLAFDDEMEPYVQSYVTTYYDDKNLTSYYDHYRGKANRFKLRKRFYDSTQQTYIEIKQKNNKGQTNKKRSLLKKDQDVTSSKIDDLVRLEKLELSFSDFKEQLTSKFSRVVLVDPLFEKKMTIDFNLRFEKGQEVKAINEQVVIELKYRKSPRLDIKKITNLGAKESSFSKYCIGTALLNQSVKKNSFKPTLIKINQWNS